MPFDVLETQPRDCYVPKASISYERTKKSSLPRLIVSLPTTLAGTCKRDRFVFEVGHGADAGKARISAVVKGVATKSAPGTMMKHALVIRFGEVPALGEDAAAKEMCAVIKTDDNNWIIELPPWFKIEQLPKVKRVA